LRSNVDEELQSHIEMLEHKFNALTGLAIHTLSSDYKVAHIGQTLIMIAISGRLLLYVRGLTIPRLAKTSTKRAGI